MRQPRTIGRGVAVLGDFLLVGHISGKEKNREMVITARVAELGSFSSGAKMVMKIFVKRIITIFASNASFLHVIPKLQN